MSTLYSSYCLHPLDGYGLDGCGMIIALLKKVNILNESWHVVSSSPVELSGQPGVFLVAMHPKSLP